MQGTLAMDILLFMAGLRGIKKELGAYAIGSLSWHNYCFGIFFSM